MLREVWAGENRKTIVCVDSYRAGVLRGRFFSPWQEAEPFESLTQFLLKMETMLDDLQMPQAYTTLRVFSDAVIPSCNTGSPGKMCRGEMATFELQILFRQHSSWQGVLVWREKRQEQVFRSVLELVMLMDNALQIESGNGAA